MSWNDDFQNDGNNLSGSNNGYAKPTYSVSREEGQQEVQQSGYNNDRQQNNGYQKQPYNNGNGGNNGGYQKNNYQNNNGGGNRSYGNNGGGGGGGGNRNFNKPREVDPNPTYYKPYAVTGNDNPPPHVVSMLQRMIKELEAEGYTMRCGGMKGIEDIAEQTTRKSEIHLPWRDFDNKQSKFTFTMPEAVTLAGKFQAGFDSLKKVVQTFLAKNVRVLMGKDLKGPALFLITWSEDGADSARAKTAKTGNAGHSIAIASHLMIPIFNLGNPNVEEKFRRYIDQNKPRPQDQEENY